MRESHVELPRSRREQIGWYVYDWANSAFSVVIVTVFLGPYLTVVTRAAAGPACVEAANAVPVATEIMRQVCWVRPLGIPIYSESFWSYVVGLSVALQVFFLPILGAIADYSHAKKPMLAGFAYLGAFATMGLYLLQGTNYLLGGFLFIVANLSFGAAVIFYNAFLPDIADADERDKVSSEGWAAGYLGGGLILALNLALYQFLPFGIDPEFAIRISLMSAGLWWAIFTIVPLARLRRRSPVKRLQPGERLFTVGFRQLGHTLRNLPKYPHTLLFLVAYLLYNDGIQAVNTLAGQFGTAELGLETGQLIILILMIQFVAFGGALAFNQLATRVGTKRAIEISLLIWIGAVVYAWLLLRNVPEFFILGGVIALVLGGSQALSRSLFSLMIPRGQEAEYFSLYEISERGTSWLSPILFGATLQLTGSYRLAILSVALFFIAGLLLLSRVQVQRAITEAGNEVPEQDAPVGDAQLASGS